MDDAALAELEALKSPYKATSTTAAAETAANAAEVNQRPRLSQCSAARWIGKVAPPVEWIVDGLVPRKMVTLLPAEGGAGKTMLEQSACCTVPAGMPLLGKATMMGAAAAIFAEDPEEVLHGRQERICKEYGIDPASIADRCFIASYFGQDAVLWRDGLPTALMREIEDDLCTISDLRLVSIDNAALVFAGDESDRTEVTQFMAALNGMAGRLNAAILLSTHKSKSNDGSTLRAASGSTAWINAARQVLELQPESNESGPALIVRKSNHTKPGEQIALAWVGGVLTLLPTADAFQERLDGNRLTRLILELVRDGCRKGEPYSSAAQATDRYLPAALVRKGFKLKDAKATMLTMMDNGVLKQTERTRNRRAGLVVAADVQKDPD